MAEANCTLVAEVALAEISLTEAPVAHKIFSHNV